jgi:glyoxylase-like metal-dependent hydrolase (beta-lactamase superfamily II)
MKHVAGNVFAVYGYFGYLNMYVIDTGAGLIVVDAGLNQASIHKLEKGLKANKYSFADVRHILITHHHFDHIGGLSYLQERTQATTYAHHLDAPYIRGEAPPAYADKDTLRGASRQVARFLRDDAPPARVDVELQGGEKLNRVLPGLQVVHLPGHSPGHVGYYLPESHTLIGGDVMLSTPFGLRMPLRAPTFNWEEAQESVRKVAAMDILVLCLGHGRPRLGNADIPVEKLVKKLR